MEKMVRYAAEVTQAGTPLVRRILAESSGDANALVNEVLDLQNALSVSRGEGSSSGDGGGVPAVAPSEEGTHVVANERSYPRKGKAGKGPAAVPAAPGVQTRSGGNGKHGGPLRIRPNG